MASLHSLFEINLKSKTFHSTAFVRLRILKYSYPNLIPKLYTANSVLNRYFRLLRLPQFQVYLTTSRYTGKRSPSYHSSWRMPREIKDIHYHIGIDSVNELVNSLTRIALQYEFRHNHIRCLQF